MWSDLEEPGRQRSLCCCGGSWNAAVVHLRATTIIVCSFLRMILKILSTAITSRYFGVAGQGSPNSPELISMLHDWLPSHLGGNVVRGVKMVKMVRMTKMIMSRKWGRWVGFSILCGLAINWESGGGEKNFRAELSCLSFSPTQLYPLTGKLI